MINLLQFLGIILGVAGLLQLFKLLGKPSKEKLLTYFKGAIAPRKRVDVSSSSEADTASVNDSTREVANSVTDTSAGTPGNDPRTSSSNHSVEGDEIDVAMGDETFDDYSGQAILKVKVVSDFTQVLMDQSEQADPPSAAGLTPSTTDLLYATVQASVTRLEQQMKEVYALQLQQMTLLQAGPASSAVSGTAPEPDHALVGGGLSAQLGQTDEPSFLMNLSETDGFLPEDAVINLSVAEAQEDFPDAPERGVEINQYFYSLLKTKEMAHNLVEAIRLNKPAPVIKTRSRQVVRSIDHYGQHRDANVAVAMVSMLSSLPLKQLRRHDEDLTSIGRLIGMSPPGQDESHEQAGPVEADSSEPARVEKSADDTVSAALPGTTANPFADEDEPNDQPGDPGEHPAAIWHKSDLASDKTENEDY